MKDNRPIKRRNKKCLDVKETDNIKKVLNLIDNLLEGQRFGEVNSTNQMYLMSCQSRIDDMKNGYFTENDLIFLRDTIDSLTDMLMAAGAEIKLYIKEG